MSVYKFSVTIYVDSDTTPTDDTIGLSNGVFFWTLGEFVDFDSSFTNGKGILTRDGISPITKSVNVKRMGDIANIDGLNLSIDNTEKFWIKFITAFGDNASLHGSRVEIREYPTDQDPTNYLIYQGTCDLPSFSKSTFKIPVRSLGDSRDSQLGLDITDEYKQITIDGDLENVTDQEAIGKIVPISFGKLDKASFLKTGGEEKVLTIGNSDQLKQTFPVYEVLSGNRYAMTISSSNSSSEDGIEKIVDLGNNTEYFVFKSCLRHGSRSNS